MAKRMNGSGSLRRSGLIAALARYGLATVWLPHALMAAEWEAELARRWDARIGRAETRMAGIRQELGQCPTLPVDDQGGTGGFASLHREGVGEFAINITWGSVRAIDFVALVPARRYEIEGLNREYGMPDAFRVECLDADGGVGAILASFEDLWRDPVRDGHPFVIELGQPIDATGLRIVATRLPADGDRFVHAWAEVFGFGEAFRLGPAASVSSEHGQRSLAPWQWAPAFLVDGQTPLGLPELPGEPHRDVGWLSRGASQAGEVTWLDVDLGEVRRLDRLRLMPAKRPTPDLPSGFGFPRAMRIRLAETSEGLGGAVPVESWRMRNPGHNPVNLGLPPSRARWIRIEATRLWKPFESYPAFFALSEVEVWDGQDKISIGAKARSPHGMGGVVAAGARLWNTSSLCDGYGPEGRLVGEREWLRALDRRLRLETELDLLQRQNRDIIEAWRQGVFWGLGSLGGLGAAALLLLPLRYRLREKRQLQQVRERIAGDLHDEVGSNLGSIQMLADLAEGRTGQSRELSRIQRIAAETVSAVRDIVWLLRPHGGARIGTAEHLRETASIMLERLDWKFTANEAAWQTELSDEQNRHLFLFFREALHNILRHAEAGRVGIRVEDDGSRMHLRIEDDGVGIPESKRTQSSTLRALRQRAEALQANFVWECPEAGGTRLDLRIPWAGKRRTAARG